MRKYWATENGQYLAEVDDALQEAESLSESLDVLCGQEAEWGRSQPDAPVRPSGFFGGVSHRYHPSPFKWSLNKAADWVKCSEEVEGTIAVVIDHDHHDNFSNYFHGIFVGRVIRSNLLPGGEEHEIAGEIDLDEWYSVTVDSGQYHLDARILIDRVIEYGRVDGVTIPGNPYRHQIKPIVSGHMDVHPLSKAGIEDIGFWELEKESSGEPSDTSLTRRWGFAALKFYVSGLIQHILTSSTFRAIQSWMNWG